MQFWLSVPIQRIRISRLYKRPAAWPHKRGPYHVLWKAKLQHTPLGLFPLKAKEGRERRRENRTVCVHALCGVCGIAFAARNNSIGVCVWYGLNWTPTPTPNRKDFGLYTDVRGRIRCSDQFRLPCRKPPNSPNSLFGIFIRITSYILISPRI